jgi:hypothetical protein
MLKRKYKNYKFNPRVVKCWNDGKLLSDNNFLKYEKISILRQSFGAIAHWAT